LYVYRFILRIYLHVARIQTKLCQVAAPLEGLSRPGLVVITTSYRLDGSGFEPLWG
jgi:hypothetical protein